MIKSVKFKPTYSISWLFIIQRNSYEKIIKFLTALFKISLVTAALGLVNSALAADVACNSSGVTITGQSGAVLNQCSINPISPTNEPEWGSLSAVNDDKLQPGN